MTAVDSDGNDQGDASAGAALSPGRGGKLLSMPATARVLLVARPHLAYLVAAGKLGEVVVNADGEPCLHEQAVIAYKARRKDRRREALDRVTELSEEMGLYGGTRETGSSLGRSKPT